MTPLLVSKVATEGATGEWSRGGTKRTQDKTAAFHLGIGYQRDKINWK